MHPSARNWLWLTLIAAAVGCSTPTTLISCLNNDTVCAGRCVDPSADDANCGGCGHACGSGASCFGGACVTTTTAPCSLNNGNCGANADCIDQNGTAVCACHPGFTGPSCAMCSVCVPGQFASTPCSPAADTVCTACSGPCLATEFMPMPCTPISDRVCQACSSCATNQYVAGPCTPISDTVCAPCDANCATCTGPGQCTSCVSGAPPEGGSCPPGFGPVCSNGVIESGETCDDGNSNDGDGCSSTCQVEAGYYCFGAGPSICGFGNCASDPLTQLPPISASFVVNGTASASASGTQLMGRGTIATVGDLAYPLMIEADVQYMGSDVTLLGARGTGQPDAGNNNLPDNSVWAQLTASAPFPVEIDTGPGTTQIASGSAASFAPTIGITYRVRYVDDGYGAHVDWYNLVNPAMGMTLPAVTSFHGGGDRAFVGGGDMSALTVANIRACSAPLLPSISGLVARYTAIGSWNVVADSTGKLAMWKDVSGNGNDLNVNVAAPYFRPALINGRPAIDFSGGAGLVSAPFALGTEATVFVVMQHRTPDQWGAIAHHGDRDVDWSLEQSGFAPNGTGSYPGSIDTYHFQTNNDNANEDLTLTQNTNYILTASISTTALTRFFSTTAFDGTTQTASFNDSTASLVPMSKQLYVGLSNNNEASNAYIGELIYYNRALVATERAQVISYLRGIWGP